MFPREADQKDKSYFHFYGKSDVHDDAPEADSTQLFIHFDMDEIHQIFLQYMFGDVNNGLDFYLDTHALESDVLSNSEYFKVILNDNPESQAIAPRKWAMDLYPRLDVPDSSHCTVQNLELGEDLQEAYDYAVDAYKTILGFNQVE